MHLFPINVSSVNLLRCLKFPIWMDFIWFIDKSSEPNLTLCSNALLEILAILLSFKINFYNLASWLRTSSGFLSVYSYFCLIFEEQQLHIHIHRALSKNWLENCSKICTKSLEFRKVLVIRRHSNVSRWRKVTFAPTKSLKHWNRILKQILHIIEVNGR